MGKLIRCIEGHVYDADRHDACPKCGAVPGDDRVATENEAGSKVPGSKPRSGRQAGAAALPLRWLAAGGAILVLTVAAAAYFWPHAEEPQPVARNEQVNADSARSGMEGGKQVPAGSSADADSKGPGSDAETSGKEAVGAATNAQDGPDTPGNDNNAALRVRAEQHLTDKDYDSAIADFTDIVRTGHGTPSDYDHRGMAHHFKKEHQAALEDYDRAIGLDDHNTQAHYHRAALYRDIGDFDKALMDLDAAIGDHGTTNPYYYVERARNHETRSHYDKAVADYTKAIDLWAKDETASKTDKAWAFYYRGVAKQRKILRDWQECDRMIGASEDCKRTDVLASPLLDFEAAAALNPDIKELYVQMGAVQLDMGKTQNAIDSYTKAIALDPAYARAYSNRCLAYTIVKMPDLALADCNAAIRLDAGNAYAWANRGVIYSSKRGRKNRNQAISDLRQALKIEPNNNFARQSLRKMGVKP